MRESLSIEETLPLFYLGGVQASGQELIINFGFGEVDIGQNIRWIADELEKLLVQCDVVTINSFMSPSQKRRDMAKEFIELDDFFEVIVDVPLEVSEDRDVKGIKKKA